MNSYTVIWLIVLIICLGVELATLGLTSIWFAGGAIPAIVAAALSAPVWTQVVLFLLVSLILLFFTRPIAVKYFNKDRIKTNAESLIGRTAIVISDIDNLEGTGQVTVSGLEWSARSADERIKLQTGTVVIIRAINGVKLIVEERKED